VSQNIGGKKGGSLEWKQRDRGMLKPKKKKKMGKEQKEARVQGAFMNHRNINPHFTEKGS